jgi:hypothetical protein
VLHLGLFRDKVTLQAIECVNEVERVNRIADESDITQSCPQTSLQTLYSSLIVSQDI